MLSSKEIRQRYLAFFQERGHAVIPSASLVPENDPTILFTTAGMQPLVPYLLGLPHPLGKRLVSVQKCVRTQDIEEVGDNRHDTFFEMLGNWSLGDYFKDQTIRWSFEFLTSVDKGLGLDPQRLFVTVFAGDTDAPKDEESIGIWQEMFAGVGITAKVDTTLAEGGRIFTRGREDNWWGPAGQTGPCGPDTEIFYDLGEGHGSLTAEDGLPDLDGGRLIEIWNNVFMRYEKTTEGTFVPLTQHNVDTGMGLERVATALQNVETIFETDLFAPLMAVVPESLDTTSRRIVADHLRSAVMLATDGVRPSNKDRGYVLRRLIRRAVLRSELEDLPELTAFITHFVAEVAKIYRDTYADFALQAVIDEVRAVLVDEAERFLRTVAKGKQEIRKRTTLSGKEAFDVYQSYGFPLELTKEYAASQGITINEADFEAEFRRHQELSRTASAGQFASGLADHSEQTVRYHTATHLLHQALRTILGSGVAQKGSNITPERLRFDFSYPEKLTDEQKQAIEAEVNAQIQAHLPVSVATMSPEQAKAEGAIGLFGDKYGTSVSVYSIGTYSKEICTGPHVQNTAELGTFRILKEEAVSAGVRRIKAVLE